jgi:spore coat protein A, manganese oxidase
MTNDANGPYPTGAPVDPQTTGQVMAFRVRNIAPIRDVTLPATLNTITPLVPGAVTRQLGLYEGLDSNGRLIQKLGTLARPANFTDNVTEVIKQGDTETWQIYNTTMDTHPIHLHQVSFQVVGRLQKFNWKIDPATGGIIVTGLTGKLTPPAANEVGWKDTVQMNPGEVTIIKARFDLPGRYVWHCHILEHEEHDMMRPFLVLPPVVVASTQTVSTASASPTTAIDTAQLLASPLALDGATLLQPFATSRKRRWVQ